jgi:hypothetical protein
VRPLEVVSPQVLSFFKFLTFALSVSILSSVVLLEEDALYLECFHSWHWLLLWRDWRF